jgi:hypothetical protein
VRTKDEPVGINPHGQVEASLSSQIGLASDLNRNVGRRLANPVTEGASEFLDDPAYPRS